MYAQDFGTWARNLTRDVHVGPRARSLIEDATVLVWEILEHGELQDPIQDKTRMFVSETLPTTIKEVTKLYNLHDDDFDAFFAFMQSCLSLAVWATTSPSKATYVPLFEVVPEILHSSAYFYNYCTSVTIKNPFGTLTKTFVVSGEWDVLLNQLLCDVVDPDILRLCLEIMTRASKDKDLLKDDAIVCLIHGMATFLDQSSSPENLPKFSLNESTRKMIKDYLSIAHQHDSVDGIIPLFRLIDACMRSDKMTLHLAGVELLDYVVPYLRDDFLTVVKLWDNETGFLKYLLTKQFHTHVLNNLVGPFRSLASHDVFEDDVLDHLWKMVLSVHSSQKDALFQLLIATLKAGPEARAEKFIENMLSGELDATEIAFLANLCPQVPSAMGIRLADVLFDKAKSDEGARKMLLEAIQKNLSGSVTWHLVQMCLEELKASSESDISHEYLPWLVRATQRMEAKYVEALIDQLFEVIHCDRKLVLQLLVTLLADGVKILGPDEIEKLGAERNDVFWKMMQVLLNLQGSRIVTEEGFVKLKEIIDSFDFSQSSREFASFLWSFVIIMNCKEGNVVDSDALKTRYYVKPPPLFCFCNYPLVGVEYVFRLLAETQDTSVVTQAEMYLLTLGSAYREEKLERCCKFIQENYLDVIDQIEDPQKERYIKSLLSLAKSMENHLADTMGTNTFIRHNIPGGRAYVRCSFPQNVVIVLVEKRTTDLWKVAERCGQCLKCDSSSPSVTFYRNGSYVQRSAFVEEFFPTILDLVELDAKASDAKGLKQVTCESFYPSQYLIMHDFGRKLYGLLANEKVQDAAWDLLQFLPDSPHIANAIDENIQEVISELRGNGLPMRYCCECFLNSMRYRKKASVVSVAPELLDVFLEVEPHREHLCFLQLARALYSQTIGEDLAGKLIKKTLCYLCDGYSDAKQEAATFLEQLLSDFPDTEILVENMDLVEKIMMSADVATWTTIRNAITKTSDLAPLFTTILPYLDNLEEMKSDSRYVIDMFVSLLPHLEGLVEMSEVVTHCLKLMRIQTGEVLKTVCEVASSILVNNAGTTDIPPGFVREMLIRCFSTSNMDMQNSIISVCSQVAKQNPEEMKEMVEFLAEKAQYTTSSWSYVPENNQRTEPYSGLSNLGATCYMNSILQQLYHIVQFRKNVLSSEFEKEDQRELQKLFARMSLSLSPRAETRKFCETWKGWGNKPINVREQQDAGEFLNHFLDQLPEACQELLKCTVVNKIMGIDIDYVSENVETLFTLPIDVKGFPDIQASFQSFLQDETFCGEDSLMTPLGKIDAKKFARVRSAPPVLAVHLKRFEYDLRYGKYKVTDRFVFPQKINISQLMENPNEHECLDYELKGVVLHSGVVDRGHYVSLVKIGSDWYKFNDGSVSKFPVKDLEQETFGGRSNGFVAFILFYSQFSSDEDSDFPISEQIRSEIEQENQAFITKQIMFSSQLFSLYTEFANLPGLLDYLFNVYTHSSLSSCAAQMAASVIARVEENNTAPEYLLNYFVKRIKDLIEIYECCSKKEIIDAIHRIIDRVVTTIYCPDTAIQIADNIVDSFKSFINVWAQIDAITQIPLRIARVGISRLSDDIRAKWCKQIEDFLTAFYKREVSRAVLENADMHSMFDLLGLLWIDGTTTSLLELWPFIEHSPANILSFMRFLLKSKQKFDIDRGMQFLRKNNIDFDNADFCKVIIDLITGTDYDVRPILFAYRDPLYSHNKNMSNMIFSELRAGNSILREKLADSPDIVVPYLLDSEWGARYAALSTIACLFPSVPWFTLTKDYCWDLSGDQPIPPRSTTWVEWLEHPQEDEKAKMLKLYREVLDRGPMISTLIDGECSFHRSQAAPLFRVIRWLNAATQENSKEAFDLLYKCWTQYTADEYRPTLNQSACELFCAMVTFPDDFLSDKLSDLIPGTFKSVEAKYIVSQIREMADVISRATILEIVRYPAVRKTITESSWYSRFDGRLLENRHCRDIFLLLISEGDMSLEIFATIFQMTSDKLTTDDIITVILFVLSQNVSRYRDESVITAVLMSISSLLEQNEELQQLWATTEIPSKVPMLDFIPDFRTEHDSKKMDLFSGLSVLSQFNQSFSSAVLQILFDRIDKWIISWGVYPGQFKFVLRASLSEEQQNLLFSKLSRDKYALDKAVSIAVEVIQSTESLLPTLWQFLVFVLEKYDVLSNPDMEALAGPCFAKATDEMITDLVKKLVEKVSNEKRLNSRTSVACLGALAFLSAKLPSMKSSIVEALPPEIRAGGSFWELKAACAILFEM